MSRMISEMSLEMLLKRVRPPMLHRFSAEEIEHIFRECDAFWYHSGPTTAPHAELTNEAHSDGYISVPLVVVHSQLKRLLAEQLVLRLRDIDAGPIDWVVGSDHAAASLVHAIGDVLNCRAEFCEKGPNKSQVWSRFTIGPHERVLRVEDLITSLGVPSAKSTLEAVTEGIRAAHKDYEIKFVPASLVVVNRSPVEEFDGGPVISLLRYTNIRTWPKGQDCPHCAAGSPALKPREKGTNNWAKLTGRAT